MARTTSSPSLAPRLPMTSEAPALAIAKAVALPMPVPPPVTMPTWLAKDAMSVPPRSRRRRAGVCADGQRRVGAVQMFHRGEDQVGVTDVLDVVEQILAWPKVEVPGLTGQVGDFACAAVESVLAAAAGGDGCP